MAKPKKAKAKAKLRAGRAERQRLKAKAGPRRAAKEKVRPVLPSQKAKPKTTLHKKLPSTPGITEKLFHFPSVKKDEPKAEAPKKAQETTKASREAERKKAEERLLELVAKYVKAKGLYMMTYNELSRDIRVRAEFLHKRKDLLEKKFAGDYKVDDVGIRKAYREKEVALTREEIKTPFDDLYNLVEDAIKISLPDAAKTLGKDEQTIEKWAKILESRRLIEVEFSAVGGMYFKRIEEAPEEETQALK